MSEKKIQTYSNEEISITFDPNVCAHAAKCVGGLPGVFNIKNRPWINVDGATKEEIMATINTCPTGALKYQLKGEAAVTEQVETSGPLEVTVVPNGPIRLQGNITIKDMDGNVIKETDRCSLCRCGASSMKPFCDGTHKKIGWVSE